MFRYYHRKYTSECATAASRGCRGSSDVTGTSAEGAGPLESMSVATPGAATSTTSVTSRRSRRRRRRRGTGISGSGCSSSRRKIREFRCIFARNSICVSLNAGVAWILHSLFFSSCIVINIKDRKFFQSSQL